MPIRNEVRDGRPRVERTGLVEIHDGVTDHFRPYAETAALGHHASRHRGDEPDPELQGGAVGGEGGDTFTDRGRRIVGARPGRRAERLIVFQHAVDRLQGDLAVAERVGHAGVHLGQDQPASGPGLLESGGKHVDLYAEGHLAVAGEGRVQEHGIGWAHRGEEPRYQGESHRQVIEHRIMAHARPDERGLTDDPRVCGEVVFGVELEDPAGLARLRERTNECEGCGRVARNDDAGLGSRRASSRATASSKVIECIASVSQRKVSGKQGRSSLSSGPLISDDRSR